ncbi:hypothetical protein [Halolamina sediminis]|uniref:hypothetical protein n=1 Tax=Halolamina sediminis TaxID=1480675 RepID=UPI001F20ACEE|nr:hypothetical protein [Halolamina sediminis]
MSWRGVSLVSAWQFTASLCFYTVFAATAFVREGFGVSLGVTGLTVTAVMLGYTAQRCTWRRRGGRRSR